MIGESPGPSPSPAAGPPPEGLGARLRDRLFGVPDGQNVFYVGGRAVLYAVLLVWGVRFVFRGLDADFLGASFMHTVNLVFHEAGHLVFGLFGDFLGVLGGSLMQWLMPLVVLVVFLVQRHPFGGAVGLWWFGQSLMDAAPYIADARAGQLMLLGGVTGSETEGYHDWERILGRLGWLAHDRALGRAFWVCGAILIVAALAWGGFVLVRQFQRRERPPFSVPGARS
jgi:hypothetical protein